MQLNEFERELEVSKNQIESPFEVILKPTFNLELFGFYSKYLSPIFYCRESFYPNFHIFYFLEKNNLNKTQITPN